MITIGSLFSGILIGGLELGLEAGLASVGVHAETVWQVEQNDYARAVLARHWPHAERYDDVTTVGPDELRPISLLCGGFPCQDISTAGKGAGLAGSRSGLFWELHRIVCAIRPRIIVLENVPAIRERGGREVCGALAGVGYDLRWGCLSAAEVGAPHRRERWFCVGWLPGVGLADPHGRGRRGRADSTGGDHSTGTDPIRTEGDHRPRNSGALANHDRLRSRAQPRLPARSSGQCLPDPDRGDGSRAGMADDALSGRGDQQAADPRGGGTPGCEGSHRVRGSGVGLADAHRQQPPQRPNLRGDRTEERQATERSGRARGAGEAESRLGRDASRLPARLDAHRWPAPPGPQHPWEPPRTRPRQPHDKARLRALGNAVVPQCGAVIGRWIGLNLIDALEVA